MSSHKQQKCDRTTGHQTKPAAPVIFYGILVASAVIGGLMGNTAQASPIPAGDGTATVINQTDNTYNITGGQVSSDNRNLFHSFQEFGLDAGQTANFISSPQINNILGRVTGGNASIINGLIQVTGGNSNLFLMNPAGIIFGPNATLNVPGDFTATTSTNIGFNAGAFNAFGNNNYSALIGEPSTFDFSFARSGAILNEGNLTLNPEQHLTLLGGTVVNLGTLASPGGNITIAAVPGQNLVRINQENHLLSLEVPTCNASNCNSLADRPPQNFQPADLPTLLTGGEITHASEVTVNNDGTISLTGSTLRVPTDPGVAVASGNIDVSDLPLFQGGLGGDTSTNGDATGGTVAVLGDKIALVDANITADGTNGGGTVLVGGEYRGEGEVPNASETFVSSDTLISADAIENGDGGEVIIWADETTRFHGEISATGGNQNGDGGFVEVSGKENLIFRGQVDTSAPQGETGTLLLDPTNITIVDGNGGANDNQLNTNVPNPGDAEGQIFGVDGAGDFTISETALEGLAAATNIGLEATNNITINDLTDDNLSLQTGAAGLVSLTADSDGNNVGNFSMNPGDTIQTQGGDLDISAGSQITLGNVTTNGGDFTVATNNTGTGHQITLGTINTNGGDLNAGTGNEGNIIVNADINVGTGSIDFSRVGGVDVPPDVQFNNTVTLTANGINLDVESISTTTPQAFDLVIEQGTPTENIEISNFDPEGLLHLDNQTEFNLLQNAGFNSITIGRADSTGTLTISGNNPSPNLGTTTTIQGGTGTIEINDLVNAGANNLTLTADEININNDGVSLTGAISGSATVTLQPTTASQDILLGGLADTGAEILDLTVADLNNLQNGFSSITIGRADGTGAVSVDGAAPGLTFQDPVTIQSPNGSITNNVPIIGNDDASITLNSAANTLNANISTNNQNITITGNTTLGNNVTLNTNTAAGNIDLQGTVDGNQNLALNAGTGNININGEVGGTTPLNNLTSTGNTTLNGNVTTTGTQQYNSNVTFGNTDPQITAGELNLVGVLSGNGTLVMQPATTTSAIELGGNNLSPGLNLTQAELQLIDGFTGVTIGRSGDTGTINIAGAADLSAENFDLTLRGGPLTFNNGITLRDNGVLTVNTGPVTSPFGIGTDITIGNGTLALNVSGDVGALGTPLVTDVSQLDVDNVSGKLFIENGQNLNLGAINVTDNLDITANGNITDDGIVTVGGNSRFTSTATDATITLDQLASTGEISVNTTGTGGDATVTNATEVNLAASNVGGNLDVTATTGNINDNGAVTVNGNSTFTTAEADADITLDQLSGSGTISVNTTGTGGDATVTNATDLDLGNSSVGGNLEVAATTGNITDSGVVTTGGNSRFTTQQNDADITIDQLASTGEISVNTTGTGGNATVTNTTEVNLAASNVGGDLNLTATTGNITDNSTVTVGGNRTFTTSQTDADITLDQLSGTGTISVNTTGTGGNATVTNATGVDLAASNVGGDLNVTALTGNTITDSGAVIVGGNSSFNTDGVNADITLDQLSATGTVIVNAPGVGSDATIANTQALDLGSSTVGGDLNATTTTGNITDSGTVNVGGNSSFTTSESGADITVDELATPGTITVNTNGTGADASITNTTTVNLGNSNIGGSLTATANSGDVSTSGVVNAVTDINLTGDSVALNNDVTSGGSFTATANNGDVSTSGVVNAVTDINLTGNSVALNNDVTSGGSFTATANSGGISNSGAVNAGSGIIFTGDTISLNNTLTSPGSLTLQPFNANTSIDIGGETATFNLSTVELANLTDGFSNITIGRSDGTGTVTVGSLSFSDPITLQSGTGQITVNGTITGTDNATVNFNTSNLALNAGIITNNQNISITGNTILGSDITLDSGTGIGNIIFNGTINGFQTLTLNPGIGNVAFGGILGNLTPLNALVVQGLINSGLQVTANTIELNNDINSGGADVILTGNSQLITNNVNITTSGGEISLTNSIGDVAVGNLDSSNPGGAGGPINVNSPTGVITTGNLTSTGITGGPITVMAQTSITTGDINSSGTVGDGGNVLLDPDEFIDVGFINAQGGSEGSGGNVDIVTGGVFRANNTFTDQNGEEASISTAGGTGSGNVSLSHDGGNQDPNVPFVVGDPTTNGTAGTITTGADNTIPLGSSFPGPVTQGNIQVITGEPATPAEPAPVDDTPLSLELDPEPENPVTEEQPEAPVTEPVNETPVTEEPIIEPEPEIAPEVIEPEAETPASEPEAEAETPVAEATTPEAAPAALDPLSIEFEPAEDSPISVPIPEAVEEGPSPILQPQERVAIATVLDSPRETEEQEEEEKNTRQITPENLVSPQEVAIVDPAVAEIETSFTETFSNYSNYIGQEQTRPNVSLPEAQNIIRRIESETGVTPVLLYVRFAPTSLEGQTDNDPLELVFVAADGRPIRKVLPATRAEVMETAEDFIAYITAPRYRRRNTYLEPAQQLYQWIVAPLKAELEAKGIQNIAFIMDEGLRTLPVAALHDGEHFLVEKYSLGMMPSLSLTDTRYQNIQNASVLAMGASEFSDLAPLPAVPTEVQTITQQIRQGSSFLNEQFTLQNIQAQYADRQYPIVHMATHGEFEPGDISNSYIQLWDQKLRLNDIRQLGFTNPTVELLVLSACRTAVGSPEAELGFAGLALQAGVKSAIASLWYVSDEGTFGLMTEFYKQLSTAPIKAEAMRQAQLSMINGNVQIEDGQLIGSRGAYQLPESLQNIPNQTLTHPYYWSAFTLIGSPW